MSSSTRRSTPTRISRAPGASAALVLAVWCAIVSSVCAAGGQYRGLWVDAFNPGFKSPAETRALVDLARRANFNTLFIEVRKTADAYYRSRYEPMAADVEPRYDPLAHVIALCHNPPPGEPRIEVHAWLVTYRVARHDRPTPANHVLRRFPQWKCLDAAGRDVLEGNLFLDPGVPEVVDYTAAVVHDLVEKYDVDGVHLDYARYPDAAWGHNAVALNRYRRLTGRRGLPAADDPAWLDFRSRQTTDLMRRIYATVKAARYGVTVSVAAVTQGDAPSGGVFKTAAPYRRFSQNWPAWLAEGCIDAVFLMNYKREAHPEHRQWFADWNAFGARVGRGRFVAVGQAGYLQSASLSLRQLRAALAVPGLSGVAVYSYAAPSSDEGERAVFFERLRAGVFASPTSAPAASWLRRPREGIVTGKALFVRSGGPMALDGARIDAVDGAGVIRARTRADGSGVFVFPSLPAGGYRLQAFGPMGTRGAVDVSVAAGRVVRRDLTIEAGPAADQVTAR